VIALPGGTPRERGNGSSGDAARRNLALRIASAVVLAPIVLAAAYLGGWFFLVLCLLAAGGILWEWTRLVMERSDSRILAPGCGAFLVAMAFVGSDEAGAATAAIVIGAAAAFIAVSISQARPIRQAHAVWGACGVLYAGAAFLGPAVLRRDDQFGWSAFLFLAATVWMTDICAYAVGRSIGGPLLWPSVSPNKTWSGAIGGLVGGVAGGVAVAYASGVGKLGLVGAVALLLSALAQGGDLLESAIKRHFGAKDTGGLIPGHGGLMDRLDGFLVAALAALVIGILRQGTDAAGHGLLVW
jgi:phosphatidate cytidylyltransferase